MGREFIGESFTDEEMGNYEMELAIKYIKQKCGRPPRGVDVRITWEGYEFGGGEETQYPVISVVWDDYTTECPDEYIQKCIDAFECFDVSSETHDRHRQQAAIFKGIQAVHQQIEQLLANHHSRNRRPQS